jgi:glycine betaine/choline ABC-type transport system substrate-binding protein
MIKLKILSSCVATLVFTTSVMAGGDPRDFGPVESFDSLDSITISSNEIIEQEVISTTSLGIVITEEMHNTCKDKLNLSENNIARFKEALFSGNLYNIGPFDALGTLFSPSRWDNYFDCVEMHSDVSR